MLQTNIADGVLTITFDRPDKFNSFSFSLNNLTRIAVTKLTKKLLFLPKNPLISALLRRLTLTHISKIKYCFNYNNLAISLEEKGLLQNSQQSIFHAMKRKTGKINEN